MQGFEKKCPRVRAQGSEGRPSGLREKVVKEVRVHAAHRMCEFHEWGMEILREAEGN